MESEGTVPCLLQPAIGPHSQPEVSTSHISTYSLRPILLLSSHLLLVLPSDFPTKTLYVI